MSKRKGLSLDDKRTKMLEIFHESKDVFQLKDLEKLGPAAKGITVQSVKGIVQELVDDGLVDSEKIGTSVYFWSFPSKQRKEMKLEIEKLETQHTEADKKLNALTGWAENEREKEQGREECSRLQKNISELEKRQQQLEKELEKCKENDPAAIQRRSNETKQILEGANRWTDNIFYIKSWCKRKFGFEDKQLDKNFGIPEDLDYLQD